MNEKSLQKPNKQIALARILVYRLERLSADSIWAHRASGVRGSLLKSIARVEDNDHHEESEHLDLIIRQGFQILENAAREL